jgi:UDP-N-acetyl-D-glucosamine/UDP-N-acetyl-D-galactosamine dehydrogenase
LNLSLNIIENINITIVGLGYVGLPLAVEFGKKYPTIGFDINKTRIEELNIGFDRTSELKNQEIKDASLLTFSGNLVKSIGLKKGIYIVTVPTPIDNFKKPDLQPLKLASKELGKIIKKGDIIIYESTVYPGCTEEDCVPIIEQESGLKYNIDFFCGYSPERINPGDKINTLTKILKITSGSTPEIADLVDQLYGSIITAGTYKAPSIKVAEAAKLIENCQRDVNISFVNELALIFDKMNVDTHEVLKAAGTKWNFLKFQPGLVGGHCIGVDPYYMLHKSEQLGYYPALIGAGRRINDNIGIFVANKCVKIMIQKNIAIKGAKALIMGFTFKENCPDVRNTKVIDIYNELIQFGLNIDILDPWANAEEVKHEYNIDILVQTKTKYDLIIHAVNHAKFDDLKITDLANKDFVLFDVKGSLNPKLVDGRL